MTPDVLLLVAVGAFVVWAALVWDNRHIDIEDDE